MSKRSYWRTYRYDFKFKGVRYMGSTGEPDDIEEARIVEAAIRNRIMDIHDAKNFPDLWGCRVYFLKCGGVVKVGKSRNVPQRIKTLQISHPHGADFEVMGTMPGRRLEESALHHVLKPFRTHGEWFRLTADMESRILRLCNSFIIVDGRHAETSVLETIARVFECGGVRYGLIPLKLLKKGALNITVRGVPKWKRKAHDDFELT